MGGGRSLIKFTIVNEGKISERSFEIDVVLVGREENCDLYISHPDVSRRHLSITRRGNVLWVEDLGSSNGTFIDGQRLTPKNPRVLRPGTSVLLGGTDAFVSLKAEQLHKVEAEPSAPSIEIDGFEPTVIDTKPPAVPKSIPPPPPPKKTAAKGTSTGIATKPKDIPQPMSVSSTPSLTAELEIEKILQRARRQADEILKNAQVGAEQKYRKVFDEAQSAQKKAEDYYRERVQEAYKAAEVIYEEAKEETARIYEKNSALCEEQRAEALDHIAEMRRAAKEECEALLKDAEDIARQLKEKRLEEAAKTIQRREQELKQTILDEMAADRKAQETKLKEERETHDKWIEAERTQHAEMLQAERANVEREMENLRGARDHLRNELDEIEVEYRSLNKSVSNLGYAKNNLEKVSAELTEKQKKLETDTAALSKEIAELEIDLYKKQRDLTGLTNEIQKVTTEKGDLEKSFAKLKEDRSVLQNEYNHQQKQKQDAENKVKNLQDDEKKLLEAITSLKSQKSKLDADFALVKRNIDQTRTELDKSKRELESLTRGNQELVDKKDSFKANIEKELAELKQRYERQKEKFKKDEEEQLAYMTLETTKKVQKVEKDFLAEISRRKSTVVKEILISLESSSKVISARLGDWRKESDVLEHNVQQLLEGQILNLQSESGVAPQKINVVARRRQEKFQQFASGMIVAFVLSVGGFFAWEALKGPSPLARVVASEKMDRQKDLEARKFNPAKVAEFKPTYTDAVIYTDRFVEIYTDDQFQKQWTEAATKHLLKMWKVDEDSSLKAVSISLTLVKNLQDRKEKIHPDFVKDGLKKMAEAESEALKRMASILGSPVRVESLKKFEKEFFLNYRSKN